MKKICSLSSLFLFIASIHAQSWGNCESVEYDPINARYLVSSSNTGEIFSLIPGQAPTLFTNNCSSPHGLQVVDNVVYVCDGGRIKGYDLSTAALVYNVNLGGSFLNGLCTDGNGNLFAADFSLKKIYRASIATQQGNTFATTTKTPNGITFDVANNRLLFVCWGSNASIMAVSLTDSSVYEAATTFVSNLDGIDYDNDGNFYVSCWGTDKVYRFDASLDFATVENAVNNVGDPADIFYNRLTDTLAVPCTSGDSVVFRGFAPVVNVTETTASAFRFDAKNINGSIVLRWNPANTDATTVVVTDLSGRILLKKQFTPDEWADGNFSQPIAVESQVLIISFEGKGSRKLYWE